MKPESYSRLVKLSPKESPVAVNMRLLVLQLSERLGSKASKIKKDFQEGWQIDDCSVKFILDNNQFQVYYMNVKEEPSIAYINLIPGDMFADLRTANDPFCVRSLTGFTAPIPLHFMIFFNLRYNMTML